jgi:acyl carrier protein
VDQQVKIRGHRIELGEIESVMREYGGVSQSVVVVREVGGGARQLVGYVVSGTGAEVQEEELRGYLKQRLPEYMVPGRLVKLKKLPLTANGKVDRKALPAMNPENGDEEQLTPPRTKTEEMLADIWMQILKIERIGVDQNFFEIGGHSLSAIQLISRMREVFGMELPLKNLFERPTIAEIALAITRQEWEASKTSGFEIKKLDRGSAQLDYLEIDTLSDSEVDSFLKSRMRERSGL